MFIWKHFQQYASGHGAIVKRSRYAPTVSARVKCAYTLGGCRVWLVDFVYT